MWMNVIASCYWFLYKAFQLFQPKVNYPKMVVNQYNTNIALVVLQVVSIEKKVIDKIHNNCIYLNKQFLQNLT